MLPTRSLTLKYISFTPSPDDNEYNLAIECKESWVCKEWSECLNGKQRRECYDENSCGTIDDKPSEDKTCEVSVTEEEIENAQRPSMPSLEVIKRKCNFKEVELPMKEHVAVREARRCLRCDLETEDAETYFKTLNHKL